LITASFVSILVFSIKPLHTLAFSWRSVIQSFSLQDAHASMRNIRTFEISENVSPLSVDAVVKDPVCSIQAPIIVPGAIDLSRYFHWLPQMKIDLST
jgi:hypothetical protein